MSFVFTVEGMIPRTGTLVLETLPPVGRLPVVPYTLGIITQDKDVPLTFAHEVQACPLQDGPFGTGKGHTYRVSDSWVYYMAELLTSAAWRWWIAMENMLMINRPSKWGSGPDSEEPMFENIGLPNNFVAIDRLTTDHGRVVGRSSTNFDTSVLDPAYDNWHYKPTEYWMATTQSKADRSVGHVGDGSYHVYTPVIRQAPEQWIHLGRVELFPLLPMLVTYAGAPRCIDGYSVLGANVYGHSEEMDVPLRIVTNGVITHPCKEWSLKTAPVPVELKPNWIYP